MVTPKGFPWWRRWLLALGFDVKHTPTGIELFRLVSFLGISARDLGVPMGGTEEDLRRQADSVTGKAEPELQHRVREELGHRRQGLTAILALLAALASLMSALAAWVAVRKR